MGRQSNSMLQNLMLQSRLANGNVDATELVAVKHKI